MKTTYLLLASVFVVNPELHAEWILSLDVQAPAQSEFSISCENHLKTEVLSRNSKSPAHIEEKLRSTPRLCYFQNKSKSPMEVYLSFPEENGKQRQVERKLAPLSSESIEINSKVEATKLVREEKSTVKDKSANMPGLYKPEFQGQGLQSPPDAILSSPSDDFSVRGK